MNIEEKRELFNSAIKHGACGEAIAWIEEIGLENVTLKNLPAKWGIWAVSKIGLIVTDDQFERFGNRCPSAAIAYALSHCTDDQFNRWGNEYPNIAIIYASSRCTDDQFNRWGNKCPNIAIRYASSRCTDEQKRRWKR